MESSENKKVSLIRLYQIFLKYSDNEHRLTHEQIANILQSEYGIELERRAISRNIAMLKSIGVDLLSFGNGTYLAGRPLEDGELRMLIDGILSSKNISEKYSHDLIKKLTDMGSIYFKNHIKNIHAVDKWFKTENKSVFMTIDMIDEAISKQVQITFNYNKYGIDKQLHESTTVIASPYQFIFKNQSYYLIAYNEKWKQVTYYRVDHITDVKIKPRTAATELRKIKGYENGIDYQKIASTPYMYSDEIRTIEFKADKYIIDQIVEWFGQSAKIKDVDNRYCNVVVESSLKAMEFWALQYLNYVEIIAPQELRDNVIKDINGAIKKYKIK